MTRPPGGAAGSILLTGGGGRLGRELLRLLPGLVAPSRAELDLTRPASVGRAFGFHRPAVVVHAAAFTDVARAERDREECWAVNVRGTAAVVREAARHGCALVHISTDYVFHGSRGYYREDEPPGPVRNYYALSKLAAEEVARLAPRHLVIRTSFRPRDWPHPVAFVDLYTSQDYVDVVAPDIALAIVKWRQIPYDTLHIATERKTAFELARRRRPDVRPGRRSEAAVDLPEDISLDIARWRGLKAGWLGEEGPG
ncbi:MAG: sugar nucleotide-binding protein [Bacillota bacterium]